MTVSLPLTPGIILCVTLLVVGFCSWYVIRNIKEHPLKRRSPSLILTSFFGNFDPNSRQPVFLHVSSFSSDILRLVPVPCQPTQQAVFSLLKSKLRQIQLLRGLPDSIFCFPDFIAPLRAAIIKNCQNPISSDLLRPTQNQTIRLVHIYQRKTTY